MIYLVTIQLNKGIGMTLERASELVKQQPTSEGRVDLFCHFEELLNPHKDTTSKESYHWQIMFAEMCGFGIASNAKAQ